VDLICLRLQWKRSSSPFKDQAVCYHFSWWVISCSICGEIDDTTLNMFGVTECLESSLDSRPIDTMESTHHHHWNLYESYATFPYRFARLSAEPNTLVALSFTDLASLFFWFSPRWCRSCSLLMRSVAFPWSAVLKVRLYNKILLSHTVSFLLFPSAVVARRPYKVQNA
jgi:hypothetical protein